MRCAAQCRAVLASSASLYFFLQSAGGGGGGGGRHKVTFRHGVFFVLVCPNLSKTLSQREFPWCSGICSGFLRRRSGVQFPDLPTLLEVR